MNTVLSELLNIVNILSFFGFALAVTGLFLNKAKKKEGWIVWIVGNLFWLVVYTMEHLWIALLMTMFFQVINVLGYLTWRRDEIKARDKERRQARRMD